MNRDDTIGDLVLRWEQHYDQGSEIKAEELCRHCPELMADVQEQIAALQAMKQLLDIQKRESSVAASQSLGTHVVTQSHYEVLRSHAKGGLGEVLIARDERLGREVALKVIRSPYDRDPRRQLRFVREAEITSRLEHPGIVPVHGIGQNEKGNLCYTMRLISGQTLQQAIENFHSPERTSDSLRSRNLELRQLLGRFVSICNTIAYAHSQGVIHRDIKPTNIMLGQFGETLIVDWGLAKRLDEDESCAEFSLAAEHDSTSSQRLATEPSDTRVEQEPLTTEGAVIGTPAYMSPEQSCGQWREVNEASDIYSLGTTLYVLLTGRLPFAARHIGELNKLKQAGNFARPRHVAPSVPAPLDSICLKAMATRPGDRYTTALELAKDIENWLADESVSVHRESAAQQARRWMRRHRLLVTSTTASGLVTILGLVGFLAYYTRVNAQLRGAIHDESVARADAQHSATIANESSRLAEEQSELALRSLQSVTMDIQRQLKNIPAAHRVRQSMLNTVVKGLAEVATKLDQRPRVDQALLVAHRDMGIIYSEVGTDSPLGTVAAAREQFERALSIAEQLLASSPADRAARDEVAKCHEWLGDIADRSGSTAAARDEYEKALEIRQQLCRELPDDRPAKLAMAISLSKLGELALRGNDLTAALTAFQESLDLRQKNASENDSTDQRGILLANNWIGNATARTGDASAALSYFEAALNIALKQVDQSPDNSLALRDLAYTYSCLADAHATLGNHAQTAETTERSMQIYRQRAEQDPHNASVQRDLMTATESMAKHYKRVENYVEAEQSYRRMVEICERLVTTDPSDSRAKRDLAIALSSLADLLIHNKQNNEAFELYDRALAIYRQRAALDPKDRRSLSDIATCLIGLGDILLAEEQIDKALEHYREGLGFLRDRAALNRSDSKLQSHLAASHQRVGVACRKVGRYDEARENMLQAVAIVEELAANNPSNMSFQLLRITFYHSMGTLEQTRQRFSEAYQWYDRSLVLARELTSGGKLSGEDAAWPAYIEDSISECRASEADSRPAPDKS